MTKIAPITIDYDVSIFSAGDMYIIRISCDGTTLAEVGPVRNGETALMLHKQIAQLATATLAEFARRTGIKTTYNEEASA